MNGFLAAQAGDPFDPAPMLTLADTLEEAGDPVGAAVLRGLVESGTPSLHALALEATVCTVPWSPDRFEWADEFGFGDGAGFWDRNGLGFGDGDGFALGIGFALGVGDGDS